MSNETISILAIDDRSIELLDNLILNAEQYNNDLDNVPTVEAMLIAHVQFLGIDIDIHYFTSPIMYCEIRINDITIIGYEVKKYTVNENRIISKPMLEEDMNAFIASGLETSRMMVINFLPLINGDFVEKIVDRQSCIVDNKIPALSIAIKKIECEQIVLLNEIERVMNDMNLKIEIP